MFQAVAPVEITGLTLAGVVDNTGTWNVGVDLSAFVTIPAGATGVQVQMVNTSFQSEWIGIRKNGATTPTYSRSTGNRLKATLSCELNGSLVDIYTTNSVYKWFIIGFYDSQVNWFDQDASPPTLDGAGGASLTNKAIPAGVTSGVSALLVNSGNEFGNAETSENLPFVNASGINLLPVHNDAVRYRAYALDPVIAEVASGGFDDSDFGTAITVVSDNTWRTADVVKPGFAGVWTYARSSATANTMQFIRTGDAVPANFMSQDQESNKSSHYAVGLNASGQFDYLSEAGDATETINILGYMTEFVAPGTKRIQVSLHGGGSATPGNWNDITTDGTTGQKVADLIDSDGALTGASFWVVTTPTGGITTSQANTSHRGLPEEFWDNYWYSPNGGSYTIEVRGLTAGDDYSIDLAGFNINGRDSDITVEGVTQEYNTAGVVDAPEALLTFTGTVPGDGIITISTTKSAVDGEFYGYINGFVLSLTSSAAPTPTLDPVPATVFPGQSVTITGTNLGVAQGTVDIGGIAQTVTAWADTSITFTVVLGNNSYGTGKTLTVTKGE